MPTTFARPPIPAIVHQHAEEVAILRHIRSVLVRSPHVELHRLCRLDDRIAAHADGLSVAGRYGTQVCTAALERAGAGEVFAAALRALDERDPAALQRLIALAQALPDARRGLLSAFGWAEDAEVQALTEALLASAEPFRRVLALSTLRLHRTDPGTSLLAALRTGDAGLHAAALRAAGELGRADLLGTALGFLSAGNPAVAHQAAVGAVLLGDRGDALVALAALAFSAPPSRDAAMQLLLLAAPFEAARKLVSRLVQEGPGTDESSLKRRVIRACGLLGDTQYVPWLISLMTDDVHARLAGESFTLITGADLAALDLERKPPAQVFAGPTEDADDDDVALDEDDSLPWPEQALVQRWWSAQATQMPSGRRCFMGQPPTPGHCLRVLREGAQRQRFLAAQHLCLVSPGTPLFPVCAPSWRQKQLLAQRSAGQS